MDDRERNNLVILAVVATYCFANFMLMMGFAAGAFGYIPFDKLSATFALLGVFSFAAAIAMAPLYWAMRPRGLSILVVVLCAAALAGIGSFDVYCIYLALLAA